MSGDDDQLSCTASLLLSGVTVRACNSLVRGAGAVLAGHMCIAASQFTTTAVCDLLQLGMCTATMKYVLLCYMHTQVLETSAHTSSAVLTQRSRPVQSGPHAWVVLGVLAPPGIGHCRLLHTRACIELAGSCFSFHTA